MSHSFVQVPPQSTGKKIATEARVELFYANKTGNISIGDVITGASSGKSGTVTGTITEGFALNSGKVYLSNVNGSFTSGENLQISGSTVAVFDNSVGINQSVYDTQKVIVSDPNNPEFMQRIDRFGATLNTFTDGSPQFGSFGSMMVGESQTIKDYRFAYDKRDDDFWDRTQNGGSVSYDSVTGAILLSTGTLNGSLSSRTSHFYHPYSPGIGHLIEMTVRSGDSGKANVRRRWGYFDDNNGVFFELDGTNLYVVVRSNTTGSVIDTRVPQTEWNKDQLDGSDNIDFQLYPDRPNIYFIDLQWLGAGRVRFGVVEPEGSRITAHIVQHANNNIPFPYMRTATLPIRFEQENVGSVGSSSEMRIVCASVKHNSFVHPVGVKYTRDTGLKTISTAAGEVPVISFRPSLLFNGLTNRSLIKIKSSSYTNISGGPVMFRVRNSSDSTPLIGESFSSHHIRSALEYDISANSIDIANTVSVSSHIVGNNSSIVHENNSPDGVFDTELFLNADSITQPVITITAQCLSGANAQILAAFNWEEIKY